MLKMPFYVAAFQILDNGTRMLCSLQWLCPLKGVEGHTNEHFHLEFYPITTRYEYMYHTQVSLHMLIYTSSGKDNL